jgi:hypothetical protein
VPPPVGPAFAAAGVDTTRLWRCQPGGCALDPPAMEAGRFVNKNNGLGGRRGPCLTNSISCRRTQTSPGRAAGPARRGRFGHLGVHEVRRVRQLERECAVEAPGRRADARQAHAGGGPQPKEMKPAQRRELTGWFRVTFQIDVRRACWLAYLSRTAWHRRPSEARTQPVVARPRGGRRNARQPRPREPPADDPPVASGDDRRQVTPPCWPPLPLVRPSAHASPRGHNPGTVWVPEGSLAPPEPL